MPRDLHWFENDGGPLLVAPRDPAPSWEGGTPPAGDRVVSATFRHDGAVATDYDRACDIEDSARLVQAGNSWVVVIGGAVARAAWVPSDRLDRVALVSVEWLPETDAAAVRTLLDGQSPNAWRPVAAEVPLGPGGLLLMHAAGKVGEEVERAHDSAGPSFIGTAIAFPALPGSYSIEACELLERHPEGVTSSACFLRFTRHDVPVILR